MKQEQFKQKLPTKAQIARKLDHHCNYKEDVNELSDGFL